MTLGERIERKRKQGGLTRPQLAKRCGVETSVIRQLEYDHKVKDFPKVLVRVAHELGVTLNELFGIISEKNKIIKLAKQMNHISQRMVEECNKM